MRCVPPISGVSPTTRSTSPKFADSAAQIRSHASESSKPAVRQSACTHAIVGIGRSSSRCVKFNSPAVNSRDWSGSRPSNTCTSAPPVNTSPSARITRARTPAFSASPTASKTATVSSRPKRLSGGSSITTTPTFPRRSSRALRSATQLLRDGRQLLVVGLLRARRELERVVLVAGDHMDVEVEDRLPGGGPERVQQVHAVGAEPLSHARSEAPGCRGGARQVLFGHLEQVLRVGAGDHERVPACPWVDVHERERLLVLLDDLGRELTGDDLAEDAGLRHGARRY